MAIMKNVKDINKYEPGRESCYYKVKCPKCGEEVIVYSHVTSKVVCKKCGELIAEPTGGKSAIYGKVVEKLGH